MGTGVVTLMELSGLVEAEVAWLFEHGQPDHARELLAQAQTIRQRCAERTDRLLGLRQLADDCHRQDRPGRNGSAS